MYQEISLDELTEHFDLLDTEQANIVEDVVEFSTNWEKVLSVLHLLPDYERYVIELKYGIYDDIFYEEPAISSMLSIPESEVYLLELKAIEFLRSLLASKTDPAEARAILKFIRGEEKN